MKTLKKYITESIKPLPNGQTGLIVFDIDDTLIHADGSLIKIYKHPNGDKSLPEVALTSAEFAEDPDAKNHKDWFDYREFQNPVKVTQSIIHGTPIIRNLRILDAYVRAGYEMCFLTARGCEDAVKYGIKKMLKFKDEDGELKDISSKFNSKLSAAVNDMNKKYKGSSDAEKKANILIELCTKFDKVVFVDDDQKNVDNAKALKLDNLTVIKAWK